MFVENSHIELGVHFFNCTAFDGNNMKTHVGVKMQIILFKVEARDE